MSSNKTIREKMIEIYGAECFIEKLHLRRDEPQEYVGKKQYKKMQNLTFHHIKMKCEGGEATVENGAILSNENHQWFHQQPKSEQKRMNRAFQEYKARFVGMEFTGDGRVGNQVMMDLNNPGEFIEIPLLPNEPEEEIDIAQENMRIQNEKQWYK